MITAELGACIEQYRF